METKLTLRLDDALIKQAKAHARESGKSVSRLVADFFSVIDKTKASPGAAVDVSIDSIEQNPLPPITRSMLGAVFYEDNLEDKSAYQQHLEEKYR
ncbi:MAG: DUF6364 family protein [Pseudomonadota bacterium]